MDQRIEALEKENQILRQRLEKIENLSKNRRKKSAKAVKIAGGLIAGKKLKHSIYNLLDEYNNKQNVTRDTISDVLANVIKRITRIGLFTLLFAILPSILLIQQNFLLQQQNRKIQDQNHLAEASRRSGQMFIMGDVLSDINSELNGGSTELSATLTGRIASLSRAMKPYRYFKDGKLTEKVMSPERGQLLLTLINSKLEPDFFIDAIIHQCDFRQSELDHSFINKTDLTDIMLDGSNIEKASLESVNLTQASLKNTNLNYANLYDANLTKTDFTGAQLNFADLREAKIKGANFTNATLEGALVNRMDWLQYIKDKLQLKGADQLYKTYKIDSVYFKDFNKKVPMLIKR